MILLTIVLSVPLIGLVSCNNIVENATFPQVTFTHSTRYFARKASNNPRGTTKPNGNAKIFIKRLDSIFSCRSFNVLKIKKHSGKIKNTA